MSSQHLWVSGREVTGVLHVPGGEGHGICLMSSVLLDDKRPWPAIHESRSYDK